MLNNDMVRDVICNLIRFYAGRFDHTLVVNDIENEVALLSDISDFFFEACYGRDNTIVLLYGHELGDKPFVRRCVSGRVKKEMDSQYYIAITSLIRNLVFALKSSPKEIQVKEQRTDGTFTKWESVGELTLGTIISKGLMSSRCTYRFKPDGASMFFDDDEVCGYHFKAPTYHNNVFWFKSE